MQQRYPKSLGWAASFVSLRTICWLEVQSHLGYSVQSLDKGGNARPQSKSRIRTEAHYLLSSRPGLFHQCDLQPPVLVLGFSRSYRTTFTLFFLPPPSSSEGQHSPSEQCHWQKQRVCQGPLFLSAWLPNLSPHHKPGDKTQTFHPGPHPQHKSPLPTDAQSKGKLQASASEHFL